MWNHFIKRLRACAQLLSCVWLCVTPWIVAAKHLCPRGFFRQEYWSGLPCFPPGDLPNPGIEPVLLMSPVLAARFFTTSATQVKTDIILAWAPVSPIFPFAEWRDWARWSQSIQWPSPSQIGTEDGWDGGGDMVEVDGPGFLQARECVLRQA